MNCGVQTSVATQGTISWFFGSPFLVKQLAGPASSTLNGELGALILGLEKAHPTVAQSNRGGWQSEKTLQTIECDAVRTLLANIDEALATMVESLAPGMSRDELRSDYDVAAWGNINRQSDYNKMHFHVGGFWSGVYYVTVPPHASRDEGAISFRNPTPAAVLANVIRSPTAVRNAFKHEIMIRPAAGMLLLFPSWLEHAVAPHLAECERISVGFDIVYRTWK